MNILQHQPETINSLQHEADVDSGPPMRQRPELSILSGSEMGKLKWVS